MFCLILSLMLFRIYGDDANIIDRSHQYEEVEKTGIRAMSWNVRLFPTMIAKASVEFQTSRVALIGAAILNSEAEIVLLQEVWDRKYCEKIHSWVRKEYPYFAYSDSKIRGPFLGAGLMVLSKKPISEVNTLFYDPKEMPLSVEMLSSKGAMRFKTYGLIIANTHLMSDMHTAPGGSDHRIRQAAQLSRFCEECDIIGGDFNAGKSEKRLEPALYPLRDASRDGFGTANSWGSGELEYLDRFFLGKRIPDNTISWSDTRRYESDHFPVFIQLNKGVDFYVQ